jgi:hypothetical protein
MKKVLSYASGVVAEIIFAGVLILIGFLISLLAL